MDHPLYRFCEDDEETLLIKSIFIDGVSQRQTAINMQRSRDFVMHRLGRIKSRAAAVGYAPEHGWTQTVPDGYRVKGVSTYKDGQWVKSEIDRDAQQRILLEALERSIETSPKFKPTKPPKEKINNLATLITITDFHMGMKSWADSDGEDWDTNIAKTVFLNAINDMVDGSPCSEVGILNQLGDFFHWDGLIPVTPTSRHVLVGVDDRYSKLVEMTIQIMDEAVHMMLRKFNKVVIVHAEGNHDISSSIWIRKYQKHKFADEPRVEVIDNDYPYYAYQHGKVMLGFHHGHKMRMGQLQKLFASEPRMREMWGQSQHCYIHTGHLHHERVVEDAGATVEMHPTLATRDHHSSTNGYVSSRGAKAITYDKDLGEVSRITVRPRS